MNASTAYRDLLAHWRRLALAASCQELLHWDELTCLPDAAGEHRGRQLAVAAGWQHQLLTDPRVDDWLARLEAPAALAELAAAGGDAEAASVNIREARRLRQRMTRLPRGLLEELARVVTAAQHHWKQALRDDDFAAFQPWLARIVVLKRDEARCLADDHDLYAPLLAEYEPGVPAPRVAELLAALRRDLPATLERVLTWQPAEPARPARVWLRGAFAERGQGGLCRELAAALGFDFRRGRLDTSVHPFSTVLGPRDCRLAIRFDEHNLAEALFALLHEVGHGLYDQALPEHAHGEPLGEAASLGAHEALARLWENHVGRGLGFWRFLTPRLRARWPGGFDSASPHALWQEVNRVTPGVNRVRADEATYNLHIVLRHELEQALLRDDLRAPDVPEAWRGLSQSLLGAAPANDREGCLQDGHWAAGMLGYFPTYTLGDVLAAQLWARAEHDLPGLDEAFARGDFEPLRNWLETRVARHGKRHSAAELVQRVCGAPLDHRPLLAHLARKHERLWWEGGKKRR